MSTIQYVRKVKRCASTPAEFWARVEPGKPDECWTWKHSKSVAGYGVLRYIDKVKLVHRLSYEFTKGAIPDGYTIDHLCRNRACANPAHLDAVTRRENNRRGHGYSGINAQKTHCPLGHPYSEENTRYSRGARFCRTCNKKKCSQRYYANREEINRKRKERRQNEPNKRKWTRRQRSTE